MNQQMLMLFDRTESKRRKSEGLKLVEGHTESDYKASFEQAALSFARPFTADDVISLIGLPDNHHNAVGAMFSGMAKRGLICKTGRYLPASRVASRARMLAEWKKS